MAYPTRVFGYFSLNLVAITRYHLPGVFVRHRLDSAVGSFCYLLMAAAAASWIVKRGGLYLGLSGYDPLLQLWYFTPYRDAPVCCRLRFQPYSA
jgi:hypothetical protein